MHTMFGAYRNLQDTTIHGYNRYLDKQYKDKACCCGITPAMFTPAFQSFANKMLGIESYEEWKARMEDHNRFIVECRTAPIAPVSTHPVEEWEFVPQAQEIQRIHGLHFL
jgi:hypothetical protein